MGPGLIVMVGDNDAGGVSTYAQSGQNFGYSLLWVLLLLIPVLLVNQEMVVRLGAVTGVGHARLIIERFGKFWGAFSVGDLFLLNFLTIVTEFIGVSLALRYFGVSPYISVPVAGVLLVAITASGSFRRWNRPCSCSSRPAWCWSRSRSSPTRITVRSPTTSSCRASRAASTRPPSCSSSPSSAPPSPLAAVLPAVQRHRQADHAEVHRYERADTTVGSFVVIGGAAAIEVVAVYAVRGTHLAGQFSSALGTARALESHSYVFGALFAIVLLDASIIGASAVTVSTSYAFGDVFNMKHSLHRKFKDAKGFYGTYAAQVAVAAGIVLIPGAPLGLITTAVQALAGVLLPSASVFLLLLCNDREVLGPWVNSRWLNILAGVIISVLLVLSGTLMAGTLFPSLNSGLVALWLAAVFAGGAAVAWILIKIRGRRRAASAPAAAARPAVSRAERVNWRMPPLSLLKPVTWAPATRLAMLVLRGYLVVSVLLLIVKAVQLGHG